MTNFPLCEEAGLYIFQVLECDPESRIVIKASDVEKFLSEAKRVYGSNLKDQCGYSNELVEGDTHTAKLVMIEEINKKPLSIQEKQERIIAELKDMARRCIEGLDIVGYAGAANLFRQELRKIEDINE